MVMAITTKESSYCDPDCWMHRAGWSWPMVQGGICRFCLSAGKGSSRTKGTQGNSGGVPKGYGADQGSLSKAAEDIK